MTAPFFLSLSLFLSFFKYGENFSSKGEGWQREESRLNMACRLKQTMREGRAGKGGDADGEAALGQEAKSNGITFEAQVNPLTFERNPNYTKWDAPVTRLNTGDGSHL